MANQIPDLPALTDVADDDYLIARDTSTSVDKRVAVSDLVAAIVPVTEFTPTVTFETPGDLSVSYERQYGRILQIGRLVHIQVALSFTPTYSTASGALLIQGTTWPSVDSADVVSRPTRIGPVYHGMGTTYESGATMAIASIWDSDIRIYFVGSAVNVMPLSHSNAPSATTQVFDFSGTYLAAE